MPRKLEVCASVLPSNFCTWAMFKEWAFPVFAFTHHVLVHGLLFPDLHFNLACFLHTKFSLFDPEIPAMLSALIFDAILLAIAL